MLNILLEECLINSKSRFSKTSGTKVIREYLDVICSMGVV